MSDFTVVNFRNILGSLFIVTVLAAPCGAAAFEHVLPGDAPAGPSVGARLALSPALAAPRAAGPLYSRYREMGDWRDDVQRTSRVTRRNLINSPVGKSVTRFLFHSGR